LYNTKVPLIDRSYYWLPFVIHDLLYLAKFRNKENCLVPLTRQISLLYSLVYYYNCISRKFKDAVVNATPVEEYHTRVNHIYIGNAEHTKKEKCWFKLFLLSLFLHLPTGDQMSLSDVDNLLISLDCFSQDVCYLFVKSYLWNIEEQTMLLATNF